MNHYEFNWNQEGINIFAQGWEAEDTEPRAVVCLVHGMGEHSSRYAHVAERLANEGFAVLTFDHVGHGHTGGRKGHTPSYNFLLNQVDHLLREASARYPDLPVFLYGHSMGGNVSLNYLLRRSPELQGAIMTSPWLRLPFDPPKVKEALGRVMKKVYPAFVEKSGLDANTISRNEEEVRKYKNDPLVHDKISAGFYFGIVEAGEWALDNAKQLKTPLLLMHGSGDRLTSHAASALFFEQAPTDMVEWKSWDGAYHELHNDIIKGEVLDTIVNWLNSRMP